MHHLVCFSGGHSSALVAEAVVRRYGRECVTLLTHGIAPGVEDGDIYRFVCEVSAHLGLPVTYANFKDLPREELPDQFDIAEQAGAFKAPSTGNAICTNRFKTGPFERYLAAHHAPGTATVYYGFDDDEQSRIARRRAILSELGYASCYPLAEWADTLESIEALGIAPPATYSHYKHANCQGCLKGGIQHWYVTYCHRPDLFAKAEGVEQRLGYSILKDQRTVPATPLYLRDLREVFGRMRCEGVPDSEHYPEARFKAHLKKYRLPQLLLFQPCECAA